MKREFKYYPEDFKPLPVKVLHMDLVFDVFDKLTKVSSDLRFRTLRPLKEVSLDAWDLGIVKISCEGKNLPYIYEKKKNKLNVKFDKIISKDEEVTIHTDTICRPTHNILEGLYYDMTPKGAPPTQITQCQQWGFQRLVPCFDDMTAKCTYRTKIVADKRYTHLITNGDIIVPQKDVGSGRTEIVYSNEKTPMAPYLFFLGVGTYDSYQRRFVYPDGTTFTLELLIFPGGKKESADKALDILAHSISWIHVFTGRDCYKDIDKRKRLFDLMIERGELIRQEKNISNISSKIKKASYELNLGYKYTGAVYREIAMQNTNFGGMENVGNTTITGNRIMPTEQTTDGALEYMFKVKAHEFYHNVNGSEVTAKNPFELWLNEAATVFIDQKYTAFIMGSDYGRLAEVIRLTDPSYGTLEEDSGALSMPIKANGFNSPNELISNITYSKAPEFLRMIEKITGPERFVQGLDYYHKKFKHSNATSNDWIKAMEKVSHLSLKRMADSWLNQTNYPTVAIVMDKKGFTIRQNGFVEMPWQFPLEYSLINGNNELHDSKIYWVKSAREHVTLKRKPYLISLDRGYSFYGKLKTRTSTDKLYWQARNDSDAITRYMAFCSLAEIQINRLMDKKDGDKKFTDLYISLLSNKELTSSMGALFLAIPQTVDDQRKACLYEKVYQARQEILKALAKKYKFELLELYETLKQPVLKKDYVAQQAAEIKQRQVKNLALGIIAKLDDMEVRRLIKSQFENATNATDKLVAFGLYLNSSANDKFKAMEEFEQIAHENPISYEAFLTVVGSNESDAVLRLIKKAESSEHFRLEEVNHSRSLYLPFAHNRRKSLQTVEGLEFLKKTLIKLTPVNDYLTSGILKVFSKIDLMEPKQQAQIVKCLVDVMERVNSEKFPSVSNSIRRLLHNSRKAVKSYEKKYGKLEIK